MSKTIPPIKKTLIHYNNIAAGKKTPITKKLKLTDSSLD